MSELASVTDVRTRHSWLKEPRADDPSRHVYTCRRDACGLKRRSEFDGQERIQLWRWPDGSTGRGKNYPACRGGELAAVEGDSEPAPVPPLPGSNEGSVPGAPATELSSASVDTAVAQPCCRCDPPCGRPTHKTLHGHLCGPQHEAVNESERRERARLRKATSGMGVPTWRADGAA